MPDSIRRARIFSARVLLLWCPKLAFMSRLCCLKRMSTKLVKQLSCMTYQVVIEIKDVATMLVDKTSPQAICDPSWHSTESICSMRHFPNIILAACMPTCQIHFHKKAYNNTHLQNPLEENRAQQSTQAYFPAIIYMLSKQRHHH